MSTVPGPPYPGAYEHYKGGVYVVHKIITNETSVEYSGRPAGRIVVLYESLKTKEFHVRDISEFLGYVHADGTPSWNHHMNDEVESCKKCRPRFKRIEIEE